MMEYPGRKLFFIITAIILSKAASEGSVFVCSNATEISEIDGCSRTTSLTDIENVYYNNNNVTNSSLHIVYIWVLVPFDDFYIFSRNHTEAAVYQALEDGHANLCNNTIGQVPDDEGVCYRVMFNDTRCDADYAMTQAVALQDSRIVNEECLDSEAVLPEEDLDVIVGVSCDYCSGRIGALATSWSWPTIFPGARINNLDNKSLACCQTLTRTGHTATDLGKFVYKLYNYNGWNRTYFVYTDGTNHGAPVYDSTNSDCTVLIGGITSYFQQKNFMGYKLEGVTGDQYVLDNTEEILQNIWNNSRVSTWCIGRKAMRHVMNTAYKMGMTNGTANESFAFFYIDLYNTNITYEWSNVDDQPCSPPSFCAEDVGNSSLGMRALQVITLNKPNTTEYRNFSENMKNRLNEKGLDATGQFVDPYVTEYYNAIRLLINGVDGAIAENDSEWTNGTEFSARLWNTTFTSVDGIVRIAESGDQVMSYSLMDMDPDTNIFHVALVYYGYNESWVEKVGIDWPGDAPPPNVPQCGEYFCPPEEGEEKLSELVIVLISLVFILILLLVVAFVSIRRLNRDRRIRKMMWKVNPDDVMYSRRRRLSNSTAGSTLSDMMISSAPQTRQRYVATAYWKDHFVGVKHVHFVDSITVDKELKMEMETMLNIEHEHLCKFYGASVEQPIMKLYEYCSRGSLQDFLEGEMYEQLDDVFRYSLIIDIVNGMQYLHKTSIHSHGNLKSSNCLLTSRFVVKISDFGLERYRQKMRRDSVIGYNHYKDLLWTAPELLRMIDAPLNGTQKGDVYSFAIVVQEILYAMGVFYLGEDEYENSLSPNEICSRVVEVCDVPFRPTLENNDDVIVEDRMRDLVQHCWEEDPLMRPTFSDIATALKRYAKRQKNLFDVILERLQRWTDTLEDKVAEKTIQLQAEKERADNLLYQMLPKSVMMRLTSGQTVEPMKFDCVTIYFSDIVGFTAISHKSTSLQVMDMLNHLYTVFDHVADQLDVYKVETIGDAYMVVSGLPEENGKQHVREISKMALGLLKEVKQFKIPHMPNTPLQVRIGIHSGPVVAGIVGKKMPRYCLFGDTVNTAARMEQNGKPMRIHVSPAAKILLEEFPSFNVEKREDIIEMKGLGSQQTWWLTGENESYEPEKGVQFLEAQRKQSTRIATEKKVSNSSDYSSARSSLQDNPPRQSVTGVGDVELGDLHDVGRTTSAPDLVVCANENRLTQRRSTVGTIPKRRRTGVNDRPRDLDNEIPQLREEQKARSRSGIPMPTPVELEYLKKSQRKVQFNDPKSSKKNSFKVYINEGLDSDEDVSVL